MAQSYTRQSTFADGDTITAALFNNEFNQLLNAFSYSSSSASSTGHRHDGTAGEGGNIHTIGDLDFLNKVVVDGSNNRIGFFVEVSSAAVEQIRVQDGAIVPVTDNDIDLGTSSLEFKDLFLDGTATVDALVADTADINGGTIDGATIGATSASTGAFTTLSASAAVTLSSTLSVQGNTTLGNAASDTVTVTADIASDLIPSADSTHSLGDSSNYWSNAFIDAITTTGNVSVGGNLTVTGTTTFNGGTLTLGDASDDNVVFGADVNSSIIPNTDDTYDLGSSSQEWRDLYVDGTAYLDSINFNGTAISATAAELNILDGVTATTAELNILDGVTSTTAELNILDGVTSTASELNLVDGSSAGTVVNSKAVIYGSSGEVKGTTFQTATNTSGNLLIANGTGFASTAVGDLSEISSIANDDVFLAVDTSGGGLKRVTRNTIVSGLAAGTMTDVVDDTTPQLGGDLDVNGNAIVSASNGNISITPNGSGKVILDGLSHPTSDGSAGQFLKTDGGGNLAFATVNTDLSGDSTPQLGGNLDVNGNSIVSASNGNIAITPNGSGKVILDGLSHPTSDGSNGQVLTTDGAGNLSFTSKTVDTTNLVDDTTPQLGGDLDINGNTIVSTSNGNIAITPNGSGKVILDGLSHPTADGSNGQFLKTDGGGTLSFASVTQATGNELENLSEDTSPQLGGNLDVNGNDIVSTSNANIDILPNGSGVINLDGNGSSGGVSVSDGLIDIRTGTGNVAKVKFYCESSNAHAQTLQAAPHSAASSAVLVLPTASGTLVGTGDTGSVSNTMLGGSIADSKLSTISTANKVSLAAVDIDGATDIGADLTTSDLIAVDDGAGGTNRKAALSRVVTLVENNASFSSQGFATAMAIAL